MNGAVAGHPVHKAEIATVCKEFAIPVQAGGGLRTMADVEDLLGLGVERVVLGTKACEDPVFLRSACQKFPGRIVAGIDARGGRVAIKGWKENTAVDAIELPNRCENDGASRILIPTSHGHEPA